MPSKYLCCEVCEETISSGERLFAVRWGNGSFYAMCLKCWRVISRTVLKRKGRLKGEEGFFTVYSTAPGHKEPIVDQPMFAISRRNAARHLPVMGTITEKKSTLKIWFISRSFWFTVDRLIITYRRIKRLQCIVNLR